MFMTTSLWMDLLFVSLFSSQGGSCLSPDMALTLSISSVYKCNTPSRRITFSWSSLLSIVTSVDSSMIA